MLLKRFPSFKVLNDPITGPKISQVRGGAGQPVTAARKIEPRFEDNSVNNSHVTGVALYFTLLYCLFYCDSQHRRLGCSALQNLDETGSNHTIVGEMRALLCVGFFCPVCDGLLVRVSRLQYWPPYCGQRNLRRGPALLRRLPGGQTVHLNIHSYTLSNIILLFVFLAFLWFIRINLSVCIPRLWCSVLDTMQ